MPPSEDANQDWPPKPDLESPQASPPEPGRFPVGEIALVLAAGGAFLFWYPSLPGCSHLFIIPALIRDPVIAMMSLGAIVLGRKANSSICGRLALALCAISAAYGALVLWWEMGRL